MKEEKHGLTNYCHCRPSQCRQINALNRIAGERISIVEDVEGVTRDRIYATASWLNRKFSIIDTGGIDDVDAPFMEQIKHQAEIAMEEADVIVFVVSGKEGITDADEYVARMLYKTHKPIILAVNKVDNPEMRNEIYDFYALGLGDPFPVSSVHGIGTGDVLDAIVENLPNEEVAENPDMIKFSLIGRPNVGKFKFDQRHFGRRPCDCQSSSWNNA